MPLRLLARASSVLLVVALIAVTLGGWSMTTPSMAATSEEALQDARERARDLEDDVGEAQSELQRIEDELAVLEAEMDALQERLDVALEVHAEADAVAREASGRARSAERELDSATAELEENLEVLGNLARDSYKHGAPSASPSMLALELLGDSSGELGDRLHYLTRGLDARSHTLEQSTALRTRVDALTTRAREEEREFLQREREAQAKRDEAAALHAEVLELVGEQSEKLDQSERLVARLRDEQQQAETHVEDLEVKVHREREAARRERERREAERRRAEQQARRASSVSSGDVGVTSGPNANLRTVGGITVAASIAPQLEALLSAAREDGIVLGGHGYRSPQVTARLRRANGCPDVHESPASSCRVPTARPGSSMHEQGLAVDFSYRGQTICFPRSSSRCSSNAAFTWLQRHAGSYGFRNLPSEAWHWSTNGR